MIILGIDPGLATTGYGVIEKKGSKLIPIDYGILSTSLTQSLPERLANIFKDLLQLFKKFNIEEVAVEELFFNNNAKTAMAVAQARGVILLAAQEEKKDIFSYTPPQVKSCVCGFGKAVKEQVQYMVKQLLNLELTPKPDDAADALAVAICHAHSAKINKLSR